MDYADSVQKVLLRKINKAEQDLMQLLRRELPHTAFIVVAHRKPLGLGDMRIVELGNRAAAPLPAPVPA